MTSSANSESVTYAKAFGVKTAAETGDRIDHVKLSLAFLPLATPVSDAKVLTGRQSPDRSGDYHRGNSLPGWIHRRRL